MANLIFPSEMTRTVMGVGSVGMPLTSVASQTATIYTDSAGTIPATIYTWPSLTLITSSQVTLDSNGKLPFFAGPDTTTTTLYCKIASGPVAPIYARCAGADDPNTKQFYEATSGGNAARPVSGLNGKVLQWNDPGGVFADATSTLNATYLALAGGTTTGPVAVGAAATSGWTAAGGSLWTNGNINAGNLATGLPAGFGKTRGLNVQNGVAAASGDVEDTHGALILGSLQSVGVGATAIQVFGAEIQAQTNNVTGITPGVMVGVNGIALHQSDGAIPAGKYIAGVNGIVQFGNTLTPSIHATADTAVSVRADAVQFVTAGHTVTNAIGFYAKAQTVGAINLSMFSEGDISTSTGARVGVGFGLARPDAALAVALNTSTNGFLNNDRSGMGIQQKGTSTDSWLAFFDSSDFAIGGVGMTNIGHGAGTGDLSVIIRGYSWTNPAFKVTNAGSVVIGTNGALATTATDGFLYAPTCAGAPTGAATAQTGTVPFVVDTTNSKLWVRIGSTWKGVVVA